MITNDHIATFDQIVRIAPIASIVLAIVGLGYYIGRWSQNQHINSLKDLIKYLKEFK